jgi:hypothetical protein
MRVYRNVHRVRYSFADESRGTNPRDRRGFAGMHTRIRHAAAFPPL